MLPIFIAISVLLSVLLLHFNARKHKAARYLGFFYLLLSIYTCIQYVLFNVELIFFVALFFVNLSFLCYLIGPVIYWYTRSVLTEDHHLKKRDLIHFLPAVIYLLASLPYILTPWSYKVQVSASLISNPDFLGTFNATVLHKMFSPPVMYISRPALIMGYTLWSAGWCLNYTMKNKLQLFSGQNMKPGWLLVILFLLFLAVTSQFLLMSETMFRRNISIYNSMSVLQILTLAGLTGMLILPFFNPSLIYGLESPPVADSEQNTGKGCAAKLFAEHLRSRVKLEPDYIHALGQKADLCMKETVPYLHQHFNLHHLSVLMHVPVYHLEYYFRENKQSFTDYRNQWRVEYAKQLIREGKCKVNTLETIGLQSGFANRNTFITAFKKMEGTSPHAFVTRTEHETGTPV